jgi:hypothetical protein
MTKKLLPGLLILMSLFYACNTTKPQRILTAWVDPDRPTKKYTTVFIGAIIQNSDLKFALEDGLGAAAKAKGFKVVKGYELFPPNFNKDNMRDEEVVLKVIRNKGCDVILTVTVIDVKSETRYVSGMSTYAPYGGYGYGFYGYYSYWSPTVYDPGYYKTDNTYFIEANAFDVETQKIIWSVQSKAENPSDIEKSSKEYTKLLMDQFEKDRKIK